LYYKLVLLLLLSNSLFCLELSVQNGEENQEEYSILHLKNSERFLCQSEKDDLNVVTSVICAFNKRPIQTFSKIENNFFKISSIIKNKTFFIIVKPRKKMLLKAIHYNLIKDNDIFQVEDSYSNHWNIIGYKDKPPFLSRKKETKTDINFPIPFANSEYPYVGGLDILGNPIHMTRVKDVSEYLKIKQYFKNRQYDLALENIDMILDEFPDTIFKSELMLYKIRAYHEKGEPEQLIQIAKQFIREYSSDVNMAEVLADTANAYSKIALYTDADYFFERLFDEHKDSKYYDLGLIYKAEQLQNAGNNKKALSYFKRALRHTKERDTAALAAYQIILLELELGSVKKADKYIKMILENDSNYFFTRKNESIELAMKLTSYNDYKSAAAIAGALLKLMDKSDENYELLLKNRGVWLSETDDKEEALEVFNQYIENYKYGEYLEEVKRRKDALFFDVSDENSTQKLEHFNLLINKYSGDTIASRALYEKAKLLLKLKHYQKVLDLTDDLNRLDPTLYDNTEDIIEKAALGLIQNSLKDNQCVKVVDLSKNYDINLSEKWDADLYKCYIESGSFDKAKSIASAHIKSKDYNERVDWLAKYTKIDFALGNYTEVVDATKELISLQSDKSKKLESYRLLFDSAQRLNDSETMIEAISNIEKLASLRYKDIERYTQMVTLAQNIKDDVMLQNYASKVIELQKRAKSYTQSPYIEFTLAQALLQTSKDKEALKVLLSLDDRDISKQKRSRQKYLIGTLYQKSGEIIKSKKFYEESIAVDNNSSWAKLAKDALKLLNQ
jgi:tetratricopeptide (TPR) repeat protein